MTPMVSTVTYTKNANFSDAQNAHFVRIDITVINPNLRQSLCNNVIGAQDSNTYTLDSIHSGTENNISSSDNISYRRYYYDEIDNSIYNNNFTWEFTDNSYILLENSNKYLISEKNCIKEYSDTTITNYQT